MAERAQLPFVSSWSIVGLDLSAEAESFEAMSDLPKAMRNDLEQSFRLWTAEVVAHQTADDGTEKLLLRLGDGGRIECVLLREENRRSICVSSQVGCAMGCVFCASGLDGVERNLTRGEILEQMLRLQRLLPDEERLSHIVMMGMGEPLANLDRVLAALEVAKDPKGLGISPRKITISTVGLPQLSNDLPNTQHLFTLPSACTRPTTRCATSSCRSMCESALRIFYEPLITTLMQPAGD